MQDKSLVQKQATHQRSARYAGDKTKSCAQRTPHLLLLFPCAPPSSAGWSGNSDEYVRARGRAADRASL